MPMYPTLVMVAILFLFNIGVDKLVRGRIRWRWCLTTTLTAVVFAEFVIWLTR